MDIRFTKFKDDTNWVHGVVGKYEFEAKLFDEPSTYGIDNGRISKLAIWNPKIRQEKHDFFASCIMNYSRGWDFKPKGKKNKEIYNLVIEFLEKAPKRFEKV